MTWAELCAGFNRRKATDQAAGEHGWDETWCWHWTLGTSPEAALRDVIGITPLDLLDGLITACWPLMRGLFVGGHQVGIVAAFTYGGIGDRGRQGLALIGTDAARIVEFTPGDLPTYPDPTVPVVAELGNVPFWRRMLTHKLCAGPVVGEDGCLWPFDHSGI